MRHGKRYAEAVELVNHSQYYDVADAVGVIKKTANAEFDETVELHVRTDADGHHADQQIHDAVVLPHGTDKTVRILNIPKGPKEDEAKAAGADSVGGQELIPRIQNEDWLDFDVVVVTPDMMGVVGCLGKVLSPKGLMPNLKSDTVTIDLTKAITDIRTGKVEHHLGRTNIIHYPVSKTSFTEEQLRESLQVLLDALSKAKPSSLKDVYMKSAMLTNTMGPGVKLNAAKIAN